MSTTLQLGSLFAIVFGLVLGGRFIWLKRSGRWKRPWSFPVAMVLLGLAIVLLSLGNVLNYFGM